MKVSTSPFPTQGFSLTEVVVVVAVIGVLSLAIPSVGYVISTAQNEVTEANSAPDPMNNLSFPSDLTYTPDSRTFAFNGNYTNSDPSAAPTPLPSSSPLQSNSWSPLGANGSGGTATYGGNDFDHGNFPGFMVQHQGGDFSNYRIHNSGGYDQYRGQGEADWQSAGSWIDLSEVLSDMPVQDFADRFSPDVYTRAISLQKGSQRIDLHLAVFTKTNGDPYLRIQAADGFND